MTSFDYLPLMVGLFLAVLAGLRTPAALRARNVPLWAAHSMVAVLILLAVTPVYMAVDGALGGQNLANLLSRLLIGLVFLALARQVARSIGRPDVEHRLTGRGGLFALAGGSALVAVTFWLADTPISSMGLNLYQDDPWVTAYRATSLIYPAFCSAVLVPSLYGDSRSTDVPRLHRLSKGSLAAGFAFVVPVPLLTLLEYATNSARAGVDVLTYLALMLVAMGTLLGFAAARMGSSYGRSKLRA